MPKKGVPKDFKRLQGTGIIVDEFHYPNLKEVSYWFLSHAHGDHYGGLDHNWRSGRIYMSEVTAQLVQYSLGVQPELCMGLPLNERIALPEEKDHAHVTLFDAFHCPGAVVFLFDFIDSVTGERRHILHTGDFRYNEQQMAPWMSQVVEKIDIVYLDTTYLNRRFDFPSQTAVLEWLRKIVRTLKEEDIICNKRTLFAVSTYNIGKEKVVAVLCESADTRAVVETTKVQRLLLTGDLVPFLLWEDFNGRDSVYISNWSTLGTSPQDIFGQDRNPWDKFEALLTRANSSLVVPFAPFSRIVAFHATGWTWSRKIKQAFLSGTLAPHTQGPNGRFLLYNIPYSEHSSYSELIEFVKSLKPTRIIPTVGSDIPSQMRILDRYQNQKVLRQEAIRKMFQHSSLKSTHSSYVAGPSTEPPGVSTDVPKQLGNDITRSLTRVSSDGCVETPRPQSCPPLTSNVIVISSPESNVSTRKRKAAQIPRQTKLTALWHQ